jgi:hypothetical protein
MLNVSARIIPSPMVSPMIEHKEFIPSEVTLVQPVAVESKEVEEQPSHDVNSVVQSPIAEFEQVI